MVLSQRASTPPGSNDKTAAFNVIPLRKRCVREQRCPPSTLSALVDAERRKDCRALMRERIFVYAYVYAGVLEWNRAMA